MAKAVGIDLGTTNSVVACGKTATARSFRMQKVHGQRQTPSGVKKSKEEIEEKEGEMESILTITMNPTIDKSTRIDRVVPERKLRCEVPRFEPGGGGINVSRAIRKLGGMSTAFYTSGQSHGQMLEKLLDQEGLDHRPIRIEERTRESFTVYEKSKWCELLRAPTVPIESKVGAGDSTVAGIVLSLSQGGSLPDSVRFGLASGAAAVMTPGTELCRGEDARRLFRSMANQ